MAKPDYFTPCFGPWRARLAAARRALPRITHPQPILHQLEAVFSELLPPHWLSPTEDQAWSRQRQWPLRRTFWTFLGQLLAGASCRAAVRQAQAQARLENRPVPQTSTSAYCQARARLPLAELHTMIERVGQTLTERTPETARWCGRVVKVADATTLHALDTPANQQAYPQPETQRPGCGFPLVRLMALFSLASGALLGWTTGTYRQSELSLAAPLWSLLEAGDVLLADRLFGCYRVLAWVLGQRADAVCRLHGSRKADFRCGQKRGPWDRVVQWQRSRQVPAGMSRPQWLALPSTLTVRLVRMAVREKGFRTRKVTLVTTLLDAQAYPVQALAALYRRRWQVELSFRQLKSSLHLDHLEVRTPAMIQRALAMHLLAYQLIRGLTQEAALTWDVALERLSFQGALDAAQHFGEALVKAPRRRQRTALWAELLRILAADPVPDRPNRVEPRAIKKPGKAYPRLNCPRREFQEIPHRNRVYAARAKARRNRALN